MSERDEPQEFSPLPAPGLSAPSGRRGRLSSSPSVSTESAQTTPETEEPLRERVTEPGEHANALPAAILLSVDEDSPSVEMITGLAADAKALVILLGREETHEVSLADVLRYCERLQSELVDTKNALVKAHGQRMYERLHPPAAVSATISDEDAARLIFSKCTPDTVDRFGIAREGAPEGYTDCDVIAGLLTMLCNTNEQHTGHWEEIRPGRVTLPLGTQCPAAVASMPQPAVVPFGREPRACKQCEAVFTPQKQGQVFGCQSCGEYANYVKRVELDRANYDPRRPLDPFELWCLKHAQQCTCPGMVQRVPQTVLQSPVTGRTKLTRPRIVTDDQGRQYVVDEPVEAETGAA